MISSDISLLSTLIQNSASVRGQLAAAQQQVSSGLVSDTFSGLGSQAHSALDLRPTIAHQEVLKQNIASAQGRLDVTQTALSSISSIAADFFARTNSLDTGDATAVQTAAQQAKIALQQVAGLLNSKSGDVFVFAGTDTEHAPLPSTDPDALRTDLLASDTARAPFSSTLTSTVPTIEVGDGAYVKVGLLANANSAATSQAPTTGSAFRDTLKALATLAGLASGSGAAATLKSARDYFNSAVSGLATESGALGEAASSLTQRSATLTNVGLALTKQLSSAEDVDLATTLTKVSLLQTQLQASYQIIAQSRSLSLANYLSA